MPTPRQYKCCICQQHSTAVLRIPANNIKRRQWNQALAVPYRNRGVVQFKKGRTICLKHFRQEDLDMDLLSGRLRLREGCLPLCQSSKEDPSPNPEASQCVTIDPVNRSSDPINLNNSGQERSELTQSEHQTTIVCDDRSVVSDEIEEELELRFGTSASSPFKSTFFNPNLDYRHDSKQFRIFDDFADRQIRLNPSTIRMTNNKFLSGLGENGSRQTNPWPWITQTGFAGLRNE